MVESFPSFTTFQVNPTAATAVSAYSSLDLMPFDGVDIVKIPTGPLAAKPIFVSGNFVAIIAHPNHDDLPKHIYFWTRGDVVIQENSDVAVDCRSCMSI